MVELIQCEACQAQISPAAMSCPQCGHPTPRAATATPQAQHAIPRAAAPAPTPAAPTPVTYNVAQRTGHALGITGFVFVLIGVPAILLPAAFDFIAYSLLILGTVMSLVGVIMGKKVGLGVAGLVIGLIFLAIAFIVSLLSDTMSEIESLADGVPTTAPRTPTEERQAFNGSGDDVATLFLSPGLSFYDLEHNGQGNFAVKLMGGRRDKLLVNKIGSYRGTTVAATDGGNYSLSITAGGPWSAVVREPRNQSRALSRSFSGHGDGSTDFMGLSGLHTVSATHTGESNFAVHYYHERGGRSRLVFNEIGSYSGRNAVRFREPGVYVFSVKADGAWTLDIE